MSNLYVIGNCYSDDEKYAKELFQVLTNAGYTLAYNHNSNKACVIMKELEPEAEEGTTA
jgi:hypothetical protein